MVRAWLDDHRVRTGRPHPARGRIRRIAHPRRTEADATAFQRPIAAGGRRQGRVTRALRRGPFRTRSIRGYNAPHMPSPSPNPTTRAPTWLPSLLGYFIAVGPAATDMYLPAFPAVEHSFGTAPGTAQLTLATWFAGLAVGQITMGTLSDRFGRRTPLIFGTATFTLAAIGCALAPSLTWLAIFRAIAAI